LLSDIENLRQTVLSFQAELSADRDHTNGLITSVLAQVQALAHPPHPSRQSQTSARSMMTNEETHTVETEEAHPAPRRPPPAPATLPTSLPTTFTTTALNPTTSTPFFSTTGTNSTITSSTITSTTSTTAAPTSTTTTTTTTTGSTDGTASPPADLLLFDSPSTFSSSKRKRVLVIDETEDFQAKRDMQAEVERVFREILRAREKK
jgi:hypothetical protein